MSVHSDTVQGLQDALDFVKGDRTKGRTSIVTLPDDDISYKFNQLPKESQDAIRTIIDNMLIAK